MKQQETLKGGEPDLGKNCSLKLVLLMVDMCVSKWSLDGRYFCRSQSKTFEKHWDGQETSLNIQDITVLANSSIMFMLTYLAVTNF